MEFAFTNELWNKCKADATITFYFPDKFLRVVPPKLYFWSVYSRLKPDEYNALIEKAKARVVALRKLVRNSIAVTEEALNIFNDFSDQDIDLLGNDK